MPLSVREAGEIALATLTDAERQGSAVYVDARVYSVGSSVIAGRDRLGIREPTIVVFVDLAPAANWGHPCRYLLVNAEAGTVEFVPARLPPSSEELRLVHRGPAVEDWMLLTRDPF
jgi:hypothetical protein